MARLAIRKVRYEGSNYRYESPRLNDGLNILVGANGSGKSTFSNLIYYGLSGGVESFRRDRKKQHREIVSDENNYVELTVEINSKDYIVTRYIGSNDIAIRDDGIIDVLPIYRGRDSKMIFSDWLLKKLDIEPIQLQLGTSMWQLNIRDLLRLIYHDQAMDPSDVYKSPESENYIVDSKVLRKAVFEILAGKGFQDYYSALAEYRDLERQKNRLAGAVEIFRETVDEIQPEREDMNLVFIDQQLMELRNRLDRLVRHRKSITETSSVNRRSDGLAAKKQDLLAVELRQADLLSRRNDLLEEITRLQKARATLILEATQIKKMIFAHEQLNLFSADTCPYCLREVRREPGRCVCGAEVDEAEYERFFYGSNEYLSILKAKQKNVETVDLAIVACQEELNGAQVEAEQLRTKSSELRERIKSEVSDMDLGIDTSRFDEIDQLIVDLRAQIASLEQQRELELKREKLEAQLARVREQHESKGIHASQLGRKAEQEMLEQRNRFSEKYNELMRATVQDCRLASIDTDYVPVINAGEYKEASATVPRRLMYYATLLYLSKVNSATRFPRFLLIDTPDTAGIDPQNLIASLAKVAEVVEDEGAACQVILTTGEGKYPQNSEKNVFQRLTTQGRLLIKKAL